MQALTMTENQVEGFIDEVQRGNETKLEPKSFVASKIKNKWIVSFTYNGKVACLELSRGTVRNFPRLNGVQKWMEKMEIEEFKVVL